MPTYIALLRGVNVGGKNKVSMSALRSLFESLGHTDGMGRTKLPAFLDRRLKTPTTVRTWNTVLKLLELAGG
jgi:uncharacterized protein (DUF1697 family)